MDALTDVAEAVAAADHAVAMTGAGVSTASGIPDFRGDGGLWERYDPGDFHVRRFERDPGEFWERWLDVRAASAARHAEPNPAHAALADLEAAGHVDAVVTQNVDGLHRAAGSERVVELHGNHREVECRSCGRRSGAGPAVERAREGARPPRCVECGGVLKPGSVLFGEALPPDALRAANRHAAEADVFLVAGTSLTVEPAASLPADAASGGAALVIANAESTPHDGLADYVSRERVEVLLPRLLRAVRNAPDGSDG